MPLSRLRRLGTAATGAALRQRAFDARPQGRRRLVAQRRRRQRLAHRAVIAQLRGAGRAARHMGFHLPGMPGVELAVDERVQQDAGLFAGHVDRSSNCGARSASSQAARSMLRARPRRDITVPIGAPTTSAISR